MMRVFVLYRTLPNKKAPQKEIPIESLACWGVIAEIFSIFPNRSKLDVSFLAYLPPFSSNPLHLTLVAPSHPRSFFAFYC